MLKKGRGKRRLTEPHISPAVLSSTLSASATASVAASQATIQINTTGSVISGPGQGQAGSTPENGDREAVTGT